MLVLFVEQQFLMSLLHQLEDGYASRCQQLFFKRW
jgi:hypothetical protein